MREAPLRRTVQPSMVATAQSRPAEALRTSTGKQRTAKPSGLAPPDCAASPGAVSRIATKSGGDLYRSLSDTDRSGQRTERQGSCIFLAKRGVRFRWRRVVALDTRVFRPGRFGPGAPRSRHELGPAFRFSEVGRPAEFQSPVSLRDEVILHQHKPALQASDRAADDWVPRSR